MNIEGDMVIPIALIYIPELDSSKVLLWISLPINIILAISRTFEIYNAEHALRKYARARRDDGKMEKVSRTR